jgi:hypothetical protein
MKKYKRLKGGRVLAANWLRKMTIAFPSLFYHGSLAYQLTLELYQKSRMNREVHVRFYTIWGNSPFLPSHSISVSSQISMDLLFPKGGASTMPLS